MASFRFLVFGLSAVIFAPAARAEDGPVSASLDAGLANIEATEEVYQDGRKLSHLDWQSKGVRVLRDTLGLDIAKDWQVKAKLRAGFNGNGSMTDYDWIAPYYTDGSKDGWSDRSVHDDTRLDHYFSGSLELNRVLFDNGFQSISAGIGAKYTDVQWTASGGTFVYSVFRPRDYRGSFRDGLRGTTYRQKIPAIYANLGGSQDFDRWRLTGSVQAGAVVKAADVDDHWLRDLRFDDTFKIAPMFGAKAGLEYRLMQNLSLTLDGSIETARFGRGDTRVNYTPSGQSVTYNDDAGGSFLSSYVGIGVKGSF